MWPHLLHPLRGLRVQVWMHHQSLPLLCSWWECVTLTNSCHELNWHYTGSLFPQPTIRSLVRECNKRVASRLSAVCIAGHECDPDVCTGCTIGCTCNNMRLRFRQHKRVCMGKSAIAGWGSFLLVRQNLLQAPTRLSMIRQLERRCPERDSLG